MKKQKPKAKPVNFRLTAEDAAIMERLTAKLGVNPPNVVRLAIRKLEASMKAETAA